MARLASGPTRPAQLFSWPARVYYEDTDALGMVYHANYLRYFERARVEWLRALGVELPELAARQRQAFVVRRVDITYLRPAALGDQVEATVEVINIRGCDVELRQTIVRGAQLLTQARVQIVYIDLNRLKPVVLPADIRGRLRPEQQL